MDAKIRLLARVPLFAGLSERSLQDVAGLVDEVDVAAGRVLMTQGETGGEFFIIVDGSVRVDQDGAELATLGPGEFLGEIALIDAGPRTATATALTACRLLVLAHREFDSLIDAHAGIRAAILAAMVQRVRKLDRTAI
jgi:CRP/FNR family transcriptional regulator, cyclic AMP receptor protein